MILPLPDLLALLAADPGAVVTRPFLHAYALAFDHPTTGERMSWTSELPDDLAAQLAALGD